MARIAFEGPSDKVTVSGASEVLRAIRWGMSGQRERPASLHFVSSSPAQLRTVLDRKLQLDGLDWSSDTFKNQAYNLRKGRVDLLRHHLAYKSLAILRLVQAAGEGAQFVLLGDSAESDAYIYLGVQLLLSGELNAKSYKEFLLLGGVEAELAGELEAIAGQLPAGAVTDLSLIHI